MSHDAAEPTTQPESDGESILSVRDLEKYYPVHSGILGRQTGAVRAVDGVSFDLQQGETLAVVGESGCGKSTMAETLIGLNDVTGGDIRFRGDSIADGVDKAFRREVQMIFQDPFSTLNERMTVGRIVAEPLVIHNEQEEDRAAYVRNLLDTVGLDGDEQYEAFPHELSGGQRQRVGIARALALNPSLVVADEPVSALDVSIKAGVLGLLEDLQEEFGLTYLIITHDMSVVRQIADRVAVMYLGELVEVGPVEELFNDPQHPYTEALLSSVPRVTADPEPDDRIELPGSPPDPANPPEGCRFHTRCHLRERLNDDEAARCVDETPELREVAGRELACHFRPE
ncbi:oligopeptide/dipeptide ABC transporter, ATPase subunit [halophilic archaeon DL31]|jgi:oligopeptide/dipeptide ABC transporter ATP-binding protein|nr:oligopeptide/dipeptide ABC transporter, ATPase subunit [halophilic archaeon DL31]